MIIVAVKTILLLLLPICELRRQTTDIKRKAIGMHDLEKT
jgi:hypothetical protein